MLLSAQKGGPQQRKCMQWAKREAWRHLEKAPARDMVAHSPMAVGERAGWRLEVWLHLPLAMARKALRATGCVAGVCYRPWAGDNEGAAGNWGACGGAAEAARVPRATGGEEGVKTGIPQGARASRVGEGWMEGTRTGAREGVQRSDLSPWRGSFPCAVCIKGEAYGGGTPATPKPASALTPVRTAQRAGPK